jgi:hypothetical protein
MNDIKYVERQLVYLVYGDNRDYRLEAKYSILSAILKSSDNLPRILLYTDKPDEFKGWPVEVIFLDQDRIQEWLGQCGFIHRIKAEAVRHALRLAGASIFIDTDTFFVDSPIKLFVRMEKAGWIVDEIEARWGDWHDQSLYHIASGWLREEHGIKDDLPLINSGVLGFYHHQSEIMDKAIRFIDEIYPKAKGNHVIEQFSIGVAAYGLPQPEQAHGIVRHYYSRKNYFRPMIRVFFDQYGEEYSSAVLEKYVSVPKNVPKPISTSKFLYLIKSLIVNKRYKKQFRLINYSIYTKKNLYEKACAQAYCRDLIRIDPDLCKQILADSWPLSMLSIPKNKRTEFVGMLKNYQDQLS